MTSNNTSKDTKAHELHEGQSMWGGRFSRPPAAIMQKINTSIHTDKRLSTQDIAASNAHIDMLHACGLLRSEDYQSIKGGLTQIAQEIKDEQFPFREEYEDIHLNIEARLKELIGEAAGRLHTARSRNDQVSTDFRLWVRDTIQDTLLQIKDLQVSLIAQAEQNVDTIMPGFTHLQNAQPLSFAHHLLAYVEMFARDTTRLQDCQKRLNECPLGAAALAGTPYPIDRDMSAKALGFDRPMANSLDAVSDRDFALEAINACNMCSLHLSRFAEEIIIWSSVQFNFIHLSDAITTGSSIMPQKRNPDAAELVRAKTGNILGNYTALSMVMKALPLAYSKDMQEDKKPTFEAFDALSLSLQAMRAMIDDMQVHKENMYHSSTLAYATATDMADWLVRVLDMPFRQAHHTTGRIITLASAQDKPLSALSLKDMQSISPAITADIYGVLSPENSANSRVSYGGTACENIRVQLKHWQKILATPTHT